METMCKHCTWFLGGQELMYKDGSLYNLVRVRDTPTSGKEHVHVYVGVYGKGKVPK